MSDTHEVTLLLTEWAKGNQKALDDLTPLVYRELRQLAAGYLRKKRKGDALQPTALVHEDEMRLVERSWPPSTPSMRRPVRVKTWFRSFLP
jgi:ECF sigma factor